MTSEVRLSQIPLRFGIGEVRLVRVPLSVKEVVGHFLSKPLHVSDLCAHVDGDRPVFGRSVVFDEAGKAKLADPAVRVLRAYPRYYVDLRQPFSNYLAQFSSKSRSTLTRKVRKFATLSTGGQIDWATFRTPDEMEPFLREALPLSKTTYQHRLMGTGLPETSAFLEKLKGWAAANAVRGWILRLEGAPVAYLCTPVIDGTVQYDWVGFSPTHSNLSPGTVLQYLVFEQLCEEQSFSYFDFTEGEGEHKSFFATHHLDCADIIIVGSSIKPRLLLGAHSAFTKGSRMLVAAAASTGLKSRIRKILRR